jgi:hypothetical protein
MLSYQLEVTVKEFFNTTIK